MNPLDKQPIPRDPEGKKPGSAY